MAQLTADQRKKLWAMFMQDASRSRDAIDLTKSELRAAVDAVDQWIDDNATSFNAAIPLPARTSLTQKQKVQLFMAVAQKRFEVA